MDKPKSEWYVEFRGHRKWAVMKRGNTRATNICYFEDTAVALADSYSKGKIYRGNVIDICDTKGNVISTRTFFKRMEDIEEEDL